MKTFFPHQKNAFSYAVLRARIALFMEMRLGKTLVAIRWAKHGKMKKVLLLAPKSVLPTWGAELEEEKVKFIKPLGNLEERYNTIVTAGRNWSLLNYEAVTLFPDFLALDWDAIICDESTYLRNPKAQITKLLLKHTDHVKYKAILSGLPAPESPKDYFSQMAFLYGNFMHEYSYWHWQKKFCNQVGYNWEVSPSLIPKIKQEVHELAFVLSRQEADMGGKKIYEKIYVEVNKEQIELMKQVNKDFDYEYKGEIGSTKFSPVKYLWLAKIAGGFTPKDFKVSDEKIKEIKYLLSHDLKGQKVVIWFRFNNELENVVKELEKDYTVGWFTGDSKKGVNEDGTLHPLINVMCAQEKCGKMGLPWYDSSAMIFYSNHYDYEVRAQCEDRGLHPSKKESYLIIDLVCSDSIDEDAIDLLLSKKTTAKYFMSKLEEKWRLRK